MGCFEGLRLTIVLEVRESPGLGDEGFQKAQPRPETNFPQGKATVGREVLVEVEVGRGRPSCFPVSDFSRVPMVLSFLA